MPKVIEVSLEGREMKRGSISDSEVIASGCEDSVEGDIILGVPKLL